MGKAGKGKSTKPSQDVTTTMQTLGAGTKRSRQQIRFERATKEAVQTLAQRSMLSTQDLAAAIRRCLNNLHGPEWHCFVGKVKAFTVHVRYWRGKSFLFQTAGLRIMVFQSAPPAVGGPLHTAAAAEQGRVEAEHAPRSGNGTTVRTSITVLRSEMKQAYQKRVLGVISAASKGAGKGADLDDIVTSIKASLTELTGPVWHVVATRGGGDWDYSVAHEDWQLLDFKLNGDRVVIWKHAQALPGFADMFTRQRVSSSLFVLMVLLLCVYIKMQSSCDACCSSFPDKRAKAKCAGSTSGEEKPADATVNGCSEDATSAADQCLHNAAVLFYVACGTLAGATALKWSDRSKYNRKLI